MADQRTEQEILNGAYYILEQDNSLWDTSSSEYETARGILNQGIMRWENYDNTVWKELVRKLSDTGTSPMKTIVAGDYDYSTPTGFARPISWVRTIDSAGNRRFWKVLPVTEIGKHADSTWDFCYFTGSKKDGYTLNFNNRATLPAAGDTIEYEYYAQATQTAATTDEVEMSNPSFLMNFVAARMADGGIDGNFFDIAEGLLQEMRDNNNDDSIFGQSNDVEYPIDTDAPFGV